MSSDRRFSEREMREVFERAAREQEQAKLRSAADGLTLAEMQEVAASAGIAPEFVAAAAQSVALGEPEQGRQSLGPIPRGVYRTELLPGPPTDALWEHLVSDARRTFSAQGKVHEAGRVREWRNGNLRVTLEPAGEGSRLHLRTRRDDVPGLLTLSAVALGVSLSLVLGGTAGAVGPEAGGSWVLMLMLGVLGPLAVWGRQRSWAATRERQMEEVAARAAAAPQEELLVASSSSSVSAGRLDPTLLDADPCRRNGKRN